MLKNYNYMFHEVGVTVRYPILITSVLNCVTIYQTRGKQGAALATNTVIIYSFINQASCYFSTIALQQRHSQTVINRASVIKITILHRVKAYNILNCITIALLPDFIDYKCLTKYIYAYVIFSCSEQFQKSSSVNLLVERHD